MTHGEYKNKTIITSIKCLEINSLHTICTSSQTADESINENLSKTPLCIKAASRRWYTSPPKQLENSSADNGHMMESISSFDT